MRDVLSDCEFLVDSGASVSVFPGPRSDSSNGVRLLTAYESPMVCRGTKIITLRFSCGKDAKVYTWTFQLAPVSVPLLDVDFLEHFNLLVIIKGRKVGTLRVRSLWYSTPLLILSLLSAMHLSSLLHLRSRSSSPSSQMFSAAMVLQP